MEKTRKVFIGWGLEPMEDSGVINCGEYDSVEEATKAVADAGLMLAEVETEYRKPKAMTIELTPTWADVLPLLLASIESGN